MNSKIDTSVKIGENASFGSFCVIEKDVIIGNDCIIGNHVVIKKGTIIGNGVRIDDFTVIGKFPMRSKRSIFKENLNYEPAKISDNCIIGSHVAIYAGSSISEHVLIADLATVREDVRIGEYTIIGRNCTVENLTTIGKKCKLETNSYITAYSLIEDFCFIAPCVITTNDNFLGRTEERFKHFKGVTVRKGGRIGAGAVILPGIEIGEDALVAAGSVVTSDVPPGKIYLGSPAREFRNVPDEQLLKNQGWY
ncbi:MAG: N-acetyltransferase [Ignavibacteria bacterium]|nr:N-acetyltransferase [Ignavibacteria bacterium]